MLAIWVLSFLLSVNILLIHFDKLVKFYYWMYKKIKKPKFKIGEFVIINYMEYEITLMSASQKPYTYFCMPVYRGVNCIGGVYYHEKHIKKKTGLLKELE